MSEPYTAYQEIQKQRILGVIPARLGSTRLPRKVLREIGGYPMIGWVYRAARSCSLLDQVLIATDSDEVLAFANEHNLPAVFTPEDCASGTDRVHAVAESIAADIYVNIQGDEPLIRPEHLDALLEPMTRSEVEVSTLATPCSPEQIHNPNAVKVVMAANGRALYFSRATIPYDRDQMGSITYRKHLGIYAYRKDALRRFPKLPASSLEAVEKLEQLRFLENGIDIYVADTPYDTIGVDTEEDLQTVEVILAARAPLSRS
ncbi:MAG TPA: 3-deoxy-manno-octulosonate cytidylyltransferase [Silvibacterium sp.]|nr:3-deoxy-manno-octulosonate cytidylyltransferase [Silvibacterium sp.]